VAESKASQTVLISEGVGELEKGRRAMAKRRSFRCAVVLFVFIVILFPLLCPQGVAGATPVDSWDEIDFSAQVFQVDLTRDWNGDNCRWTTDLGGIEGHWSAGVQVVIADDTDPRFLLGWAPGDSTTAPIYKEYNGGWGVATTELPAGMAVTGNYNEEHYVIEIPKSYLGGSGATFYWAINVEATWPDHSGSEQQGFPADWARWTATNCYQDSVPEEPTTEGYDLGIAVVVFENPEGTGETTATTIATTPCGPIPSDYTMVGSYVDITTTIIYSGVVTGVRYDDSQVESERRLRLFHCDGTQWTDITTSVDRVYNIVYGRPTTLSSFAIGEGSGCFIATAAYGTSTAEQLDVLRAFRDQVLLESTVGSQFVAWYYQFSPPVADFISGSSFLKTLVRELIIDPIVSLTTFTQAIWGN